MKSQFSHWAVGLAMVVCMGFGVSMAKAEKRLLEMTLVPNSGMLRVTGIAVAAGEPGLDEPIELQAQKSGLPGEETFTGLSSDLTFLGESPNLPGVGTTVNVIYDLTNDRLQLIRSQLIAEHSGEYCPGDGSDTVMSQTDLSEEDGTFAPAEECNYEEPGALAVSLGVGGTGSAEVVVRDSDVDMNGASDIGPAGEIDTFNWHLFIRSMFADIDGTGALDYPPPQEGALVIEATHQYISEPLRAGHNESDDGTSEVDEPDFFEGSFQATANPDEYELSFPIHVPAYFGNEPQENPDPDTYLAVVIETVDPNNPIDLSGESVRGEMQFRGTLGDVLIEGDANMDGVVDGLDVNIVSANWGKGEGHVHFPNTFEPHSDVNHVKYALFTDGDVDLSTIVDDADFAIVSGNFGAPAGAGSAVKAVPEPASFVLLVAGLFSGVLFRTQRRTCP